MDLVTFLKKREEALDLVPAYRRLCQNCRQPDFSCYCSWLQPFDPKIRFVILIHPIEHRRRIATGRMSHLSLQNSHLIRGVDFSGHEDIDRILADTEGHSVMLYPGQGSQNLTKMTPAERFELVPEQKQLTVFVIDGSWATARKMVRQSRNLQSLPRICFTPPTPSSFRIRRQPHPNCYSTIEAIHHTIELLGPACGFSTSSRRHDSLLQTFEKMVNLQIDLTHSKAI